MVSIIIPTYNKQEAVVQTLQSVFAQTFKDFELIVVDDGSTDNTREVVTTFSKDIIFLEQENQGQGAARNKGIKQAKGDYIVFLDADDYWEPTFLETCHAFLEKHTDLVAVNTAQRTIYTEQKSIIHPELLISKNPVIIDNFFKVWAEHDHIRTGTVMIRMSTVKQAGFQNADLRISQDLEYWGLIATYGKWGFITEPLWVGNSRIHARKTGWAKKYRKRRRLCPEVEQWEERLIKRIKPDEFEDFYKVRGRVALGYAHNKVLGGNSGGARNIVKKYGDYFPKTGMSKLMLTGNSFGTLGWTTAVSIIKFKEFLKN